MKKLYYLLQLFYFICFSVTAQNSDWNFSETSLWPGGTIASGASEIRNGLTFVGGSSFGTFGNTAGNYTETDNTLWSGTRKLDAGGHSYSGSSFDPATNPMPIQRYLSFPVTGPCSIKVYSRGGGSARSVIVTDGNSILGRVDHTGSDVTANSVILNVNYTGGPSTIYVANAYNQNSIHRIVVSSNSLSTPTVQKNEASIFANGKTVYVQNLNAVNSDIRVFGINGALIKTIKASDNVAFDLPTGFYLVTVKSDDGEKSVKVVVN